MFLTLCWCTFSFSNNTLTFSCAGHLAPMIIDERGQDRLSAKSVERGPALGLIESAVFPSESITLNENEYAVLFTDGMDETKNIDQQMFGIDRIKKVINQYAQDGPQKVGQALFEHVEHFSEHQEPFDDMTVLVFQQQNFKQWLLPNVKGTTHFFTVAHGDDMLPQYQSDLNSLSFLPFLDEKQRYDLRLIGEEIWQNVKIYAEIIDSDVLHFWQICFDKKDIFIQFSTNGIAFNPFTDAPLPQLGLPIAETPIGGLGTVLLKQTAQKYAYLRKHSYNIISLKLKD